MNLDEIRARCVDCGECWHWTGYGGQRGHHPQVKGKDGKVLLVRRLAYAARKGAIGEGLRVVPTCGDPRCINPEHMRTMTESQKGRAAGKRGAFSSPARGAKIARARRSAPDAKITIEIARAIRESSESGPVLAQRYGINRSRVNQIKRGDAWREYHNNPFAGLVRRQ